MHCTLNAAVYEEPNPQFKPKFEIAALYIENGDKILLLHRQDKKSQGNKWGIPAGKVEEGETPLEAVIREVLEETGYDFSDQPIEYLSTVYIECSPKYHFTYHMFRTQMTFNPEIIRINPNEHKDFRWVTPKDSLKMNLIDDEDACFKLVYGSMEDKMPIKQILVVKETREGETRVALTPEALSSLSSREYRVLVERGAGLKAGFSDDDYIKAGAEIFSLSEEGFPADTLILRVKRPDKAREHLEKFHQNTFIMGFLDPFDTDDHIAGWQASGITTFSMDVFKSLSINDPKNMQAAMSRLAGRLAFQDGLKHYKAEKPVKLTVIGTGPAAFSAVSEARKAEIPVQVFGRQERYRAEFEAAGALYHVLPEPKDQIRQYLKEETIVIIAARMPGAKAALLIDEESLRALPKGAVIVDLTVNEGGSVVGAKSDQVIISNGVSIVHVSGYPKAEPRAASEAYAKCLINLLAEVLTPQGEILFEHELLRECWVTHEGKLNVSLIGMP